MARHRRMLAPINSNKHYVHLTNTAIASGANINIEHVDSVVAPASANAKDVEEGSIVKAVHIEYWIIGNGTVTDTTQFALIVLKLPGGIPDMTYAETLNLGAYANKKNILFTSQGVINAFRDGTQAIPIIRNWVLIPKGKQRMGLGDRIVTVFAATGVAIRICGLATYKEYR